MISVDIDLIGVPAFVLDVDQDTGLLRFAGVNRTFVRVTGLPAERLAGQKPRECMPEDFVTP